uniref:DUF38 domain-containing protein n=1 Tax=Panagrolaimus sp. PS1159 TaxID=55785 RepID=A0AC35EW53_9BILA
MIISEICDRNHPKDAQNFALTSKLNYFMFKKLNRERTEIQQLPLMIGGDIYLYLDEMRDLNSDDEVLDYISKLSVTESIHIEFCTQQPTSTEVLHRVMPYIIGTARYATSVAIYTTYEFSKEHEKEFIFLLRSLKSANKLHVSLVKVSDGIPFNINPLINATYQIKAIHFNGRLAFNDDSWDLLARKSTFDTPIESINIPYSADFSYGSMERFFLLAYLAPSVNIRITEADEAKTIAYTEVLQRIGRPKTLNKTFASFYIRRSVVTLHFQSFYPVGFERCHVPVRAYDPENPHPCDPPKTTVIPITDKSARVPRFMHP